MLLIHKPRNHKLLILVITSICGVGALLGLSVLTYTPELSHAETVVSPDKRTLTELSYMQDMTAEICYNSKVNDTKQLIDSRDNKTYWVTKLKDGNCWMTQNLGYDLDINRPLTSSDSDVIGSWTPQHSTQNTTSGWGNDNAAAKSYNPGEYIYTKNLEQDLCGGSSSVAECTSHGWQSSPNLSTDLAGNERSHYLIGNYYSYAAAMAGGAENSSICPRGWSVPKLTNFQKLIDGLNVSMTDPIANIKANPYYFLYGGIAGNDSVSHIGYSGYYWSADGNLTNGLYLVLSTVIRADAGLITNSYQGFSVRCMTESAPTPTTTLSDATYMQELTSGMCERSTENESKQLIDTRDGKSYWVTKLKDDNCWMTQNLDLDLDVSEPLMPADSDVIEPWVPSINTIKTPSQWDDNNNKDMSYDPGEYVYTTPTKQWQCPTSKTGLNSCIEFGWEAVTNSKNYNTHYLAGNYYNFAAATAGSMNGVSSICPRNWALPTDTGQYTYERLLSAYGTYQENTLTYGTQDIRIEPLYFLYGGILSNAGINSAGSYGLYRTSTTYNDTYAYTLDLSSNIKPTNNPLRSYGGSVRCVLRDNIPDYNNNVTVAVTPTISLDIANEVVVEKSETNPSTASLDVKVTSNQKYSVGISASNPNLISTTSDVKIPAKSGLLNTSENGWGIKLSNDTSYTALTTSLQTFYTASGAEIKTIPFTIGISTAPDIPNGEYSTDITITATQN